MTLLEHFLQLLKVYKILIKYYGFYLEQKKGTFQHQTTVLQNLKSECILQEPCDTHMTVS